MGILDNLKHKVAELGEKAREGLEDARDKAGDVVEDVRERLGQDDEHDDEHDGDHAPTGESEDVGPDSSSTDAVQPGYVTGEDAESADDAGAEAEVDVDPLDADAGADGGTTTDTDAPDETEAEPPGAATDSATETAAGVGSTDDMPLEPVAKDVDPYAEPLSESIGSELSDADREALAGVVQDDGTDRDA